MSFEEFDEGAYDDPIVGVANAIVTDNKDPEGLGRVKLTFPWRGDETESYWARIATTMAGADRGTYFLPEVDDEVLVAFDAGDIHYPYVIGALWSSDETPPDDNADGENNVRKVRSRSGHEVTLDDTEGAGKVEITTNGGHSIVLDDSSGGEKISITDRGGNTAEFDANGGSISVSGTASVSIEAPMVEIKGDGNVTVEAGGILTLKGSMVKIN